MQLGEDRRFFTLFVAPTRAVVTARLFLPS
nr:MAG TPA: hypothetical protein [Caudoviricetes sp.]